MEFFQSAIIAAFTLVLVGDIILNWRMRKERRKTAIEIASNTAHTIGEALKNSNGGDTITITDPNHTTLRFKIVPSKGFSMHHERQVDNPVAAMKEIQAIAKLGEPNLPGHDAPAHIMGTDNRCIFCGEQPPRMQ